MPQTISFPDIEPSWMFDRNSVLFLALVDGEPVRCMVSMEALHSWFGSGFTQDENLKAFRENRDAIIARARQKIEAGDINPGDEVLLRQDDGPQPKSTFSQTIRENAAVSSLVDEATGVLAQVIARTASDIRAGWQLVDTAKTPIVQLTLEDKHNQVAATDWFSIKELQNKTILRRRLDRLWGDLLQASSHKQLEAITGNAGV